MTRFKRKVLIYIKRDLKDVPTLAWLTMATIATVGAIAILTIT